ncbi:MAG: exosortase/archaeosortase family protein [Candidatus Eisenbacteria bacterium]|nr:exosortase/archaeosortase family protein [Candidatus Eisenbacteria bacterium]
MTDPGGQAMEVPGWRSGEESAARSSLSRGILLTGLVLATIGIALAYASTFQGLFRVWLHNPNYSHGFLIPPVAAWLLWRQRRSLALTEARPAWTGVVLLVPAFLLQLAGLRGDVMILQGISLVLALGGVVWQIHGSAAIRRAAFPLAFLLFMVPALPWFLNTISFRLKILAARTAVWAAQALSLIHI